MTDNTVKVRIGGEDILVPLIMNFATLKRTSAAREAFAAAPDQIGQVAAGIALIAQILVKTRPELTAPALEEKLRVKHYDPATEDAETGEDERPGLIDAVVEIYRASGLIPRKPPVMPAAKEDAENELDDDWDYFVAELAGAGMEGGSPSLIWERWDLPTYFAQLRYWSDHPRTDQLVADYLGVKHRKTPPPGKKQDRPLNWSLLDQPSPKPPGPVRR